jgi:hypothetical protein
MKHGFLVLFASTLVVGCSANVETRISSGGEASLKADAYMVSTVTETSTELRGAYALVTQKLALKGFAISDTAPLHLEVTLDQRPASLALGSKAGPGSLSAAKRKKPLQSCDDKEYRLGVTLTRVADGAEVYKSRAAEYHCKMLIDEALPVLVDAALADLGQPRGSYAVLRKAKD